MAANDTIAVAKRAAAGGGTAWATTETVFVRADNATLPALVYAPGSSKLAGKSFRVKATLAVTGGGTTNFTAALYYGTSTTVGSDTKIATTAATAFNSASGNVEIDAVVSWDAVSKKMQGYYEGQCGNTARTQAAVPNPVTSADPALEGQAFLVSGTFSASFSGNVATLTELSISLM